MCALTRTIQSIGSALDWSVISGYRPSSHSRIHSIIFEWIIKYLLWISERTGGRGRDRECNCVLFFKHSHSVLFATKYIISTITTTLFVTPRTLNEFHQQISNTYVSISIYGSANCKYPRWLTRTTFNFCISQVTNWILSQMETFKNTSSTAFSFIRRTSGFYRTICFETELHAELGKISFVLKLRAGTFLRS